MIEIFLWKKIKYNRKSGIPPKIKTLDKDNIPPINKRIIIIMYIKLNLLFLFIIYAHAKSPIEYATPHSTGWLKIPDTSPPLEALNDTVSS